MGHDRAGHRDHGRPDGVDDPLLPSGGNTYDRRLRGALVDAGWVVRTRAVAGPWPQGGQDAHRALRRELDLLADGSMALVDGLVASAAAGVLVPASRRLRLVVLLHLPLGRVDAGRAGTERDVLASAAAVVTTSAWSRGWVLSSYGLDPGRVHVAPPGVDPAPPAAADSGGGRLLCVGAVTHAKGCDVLLGALAIVADRSWECTWVGPLVREPDFVAGLGRAMAALGLADRVHLVGPRTGADLDRTYASADLLVLPSRFETYGMVVTEALAHGLPVVVTDVGGTREALGATDAGDRPGLLVRVGDAVALSAALARWLDDAGLRRRLRGAAARRRADLPGWSETGRRVAAVLAGATEVAA